MKLFEGLRCAEKRWRTRAYVWEKCVSKRGMAPAERVDECESKGTVGMGMRREEKSTYHLCFEVSIARNGAGDRYNYPSLGVVTRFIRRHCVPTISSRLIGLILHRCLLRCQYLSRRRPYLLCAEGGSSWFGFLSNRLEE